MGEMIFNVKKSNQEATTCSAVMGASDNIYHHANYLLPPLFG
jgi:hypothetical protein